MTPEARKRLNECLAPGESDLYHTTVTGFTDAKVAIEWLKAFRAGELKKRAVYQRRHLIEDARIQIEKWEAIAKREAATPVACPKCGTAGFLPAGLKSHLPKCKGINRNTALATVEVTTDTPAESGPEDPRWQIVRDTAAMVREAGRTFLEGSAWLGWWLACLKKDHGVREGRPAKNSPGSGEFLSWPDLVKQKTGLSRSHSDELIRRYEATLAKLKRTKSPEAKASLALFRDANPLALPAEQRDHLRDVVSSLWTGESVASMMEGLGVIPKPVMPKKTKADDDGDGEKLTDAELARHHWEGPAKAIVTARSPEGIKLLHVLPHVTDEPGALSLIFLREETAALLAAVEDAMATATKPAKAQP